MTITNMKKYCAFTRKQLFTHIHLNERKINNEFPLLKVEGINRKKQSKTTTIRWANHIRTMHTLYSTFSHEWFWVNTDYDTINLRISAVIHISSVNEWLRLFTETIGTLRHRSEFIESSFVWFCLQFGNYFERHEALYVSGYPLTTKRH